MSNQTIDPSVLDAMKKVEEAHFRTVADTGANPNAMLIWNVLRHHLGLPWISQKDLAFYDPVVNKYVKPIDSKLL